MNDPPADHSAHRREPAPGGDTYIEPTAPLPRWHFGLVAAFIALIVCSNFANALWAKWVVEHPSWLLALSSRVRFLLFTRVGGIDAVPYFAIGAIRLSIAGGVCYGIGRVYQDRALVWFRRFTGTSQQSIDGMTSGFASARWILIPFFVGSNIICAIAGLTRTRMKIFAPLFALGVAGRLTLYWFLAEPLEKPLRSFVDFSQKHQLKFVAGSIALVVVVNARNLRRGRA